MANTNVRSHQGLLNGTNLKKFGQFKTLFWYLSVSIKEYHDRGESTAEILFD